MLDYYLNGGVELDEFLVMLENNFAEWVEAHRGEPGWDFGPLKPRGNRRRQTGP